MMTPTELKAILSSRGLAPRHGLGQNFLIDANLGRKLVDASGVRGGDLVLEVGPGAGALTDLLLGCGCRVIAGELDEGLADLLAERHEREPRFTLIRGDALAGKQRLSAALTAALAGEPFTLVANLPYGVATPLLMTLLLDWPTCREMWVTIQKEVADRLASAPGSREYGGISVIAQALAEIRTVATLAPACFWPRPKVTSAMIGLTRRAEPRTADAHQLERLCRTLFTRRRKQIGATLRDAMRGRGWPDGVEPTARAESLTVEQLDTLAQITASHDV